jgi:hypothetical protein
MEVNSQLHIPATLPLGKEPLVSTRQEAEWFPDPVWMTWTGKKSCLEQDSNVTPWLSSPSQTLY